MSETLRKICQSFKKGLEAVRNAVSEDDEVGELARDPTNRGCPKKHAICSAFACCDQVIKDEFKTEVKWRCSVGKKKGVPLSKIQRILMKIHDTARCGEDEWCPIKEFMFDFSFSNSSLPQLIGKNEGFPADSVFELLLAAESEVQGGSPEDRIHLVTRDLVKLCLVNSRVRVLVYKGYENTNADKDNRETMRKAIERTIQRCYGKGKGKIPGEWLFLGLLGKWPADQTAYQHILTPSMESLTEMEGW